jgi:hypothetical protein
MILIYYQAIESISRSDLAEMVDLKVASMLKKAEKLIWTTEEIKKAAHKLRP